MKKVDYIIVGNGLAAVSLIWKLIRSGKSVCQVFDPAKQSASSVAAGMYNPLVFKRITKSWKIEYLLPAMNAFYRDIEETFNIKILNSRDIIKLLVEDEIERWKTKVESGKFDDYIIKLSTELPFREVKKFAGYGQVTNSGFVDISNLVVAVNSLADVNYDIIKEEFKYPDIELNNGFVNWKNYTTERLVFCEGAHAVNNPYFSHIPYYLTAGDILELKIPNFQEEYILNKNIFLLPLGNSKYLCGSTYNWTDLNYSVQTVNKVYLVDKLRSIISLPFEIIFHRAGIRPTIKDRRPVLGMHSEFSQLAYFNGLGTRAVMLAPYFAEEMLQHLEQGKDLSAEVDIKRFYS